MFVNTILMCPIISRLSSLFLEVIKLLITLKNIEKHEGIT